MRARHWQRLCEDVGPNVAQLRRRARDLCDLAAEKYPDILASLDVSDALARHVATTIEQRSEWQSRP